MDKNEKFVNVTKEMIDLCARKNKDYGDSVTDTYKKYGLISYLVRMEDKLNRVRTLIQNKTQQVNDEKIRDTLIDLANYSVLAIIEMDSDDNE